jgi:hypothetical protein
MRIRSWQQTVPDRVLERTPSRPYAPSLCRESVELFVTRGIDEIGDPAAAAVAQARALERLGVPHSEAEPRCADVGALHAP